MNFGSTEIYYRTCEITNTSVNIAKDKVRLVQNMAINVQDLLQSGTANLDNFHVHF